MYTLTLAKPRFKFSSSHFTIFSESEAERLHGHNYRVSVKLAFTSVTEDTGLTMDFNLIKKEIFELCELLDEKILLPTESPYLEVGEVDEQVEVKFAEKFYSFPKADCLFLGVRNISTEELARWFHSSLKNVLQEKLGEDLSELGMSKMNVSINESIGQTVSYTG